MTATDLDTATAVFATYASARDAADKAMPRRKHNRPYPQSSGRDSARAEAPRWIVLASSNLVLLTDGTMYDVQRKVTVRA